MAIFNGTPGNDLLEGTPNADTLLGFAGNDTLFGRAGNDWLSGGEDKDLLFGESGNDTLYGDLGDDTVYGGDGDDLLFGSQGAEANFADESADVLYGEAGNDTLYGLAGKDVLSGGDGDDLISSNEGDDSVTGGNGNDTLFGGKGNDVLLGDAGNDRLLGNLGADTLAGGEGNDTFVIGRRFDIPGFRSTGGSTLTDADWILDFTSGEDVIELIGGLTFAELNIFAGNGAFAGNTIIQDKGTGEYLAILQAGNDIIDPVSDFNPPGIADPITPPASLSTLQFSAPNFSINEDGTPVAAVNINRTGNSVGAVSVTVLLNGGTAIGGAPPLAAPIDYDNSFITVNWADGDTATKTVAIPLYDNTVEDGNKTVNLTLSFPTGDAIIGDQNTAVLTIVDNDSSTPNPTPTPTPTPSPILVLDNDAVIADDTGIVHFGITPVGSDVVRTLTVKNRGTSDINLGTLNLPDGFSLAGGFDSPILAAGTQEDFYVRLNTQNTGIFNGTLSFSNNGINGTPYDFTLRGIVSNLTDAQRSPEIEVRRGTVEIFDLNSETVNFGTTTLGTPIRQTFTIANTGTGSLLLDGWQLPRGFSFVGNLPSAIAPGTSDQITVELDGRIAGNFQGQLGVGTNDADEKSFDFPITGTVITGQQVRSQIDPITGTGIQLNDDLTNSGNSGNSIDSRNNLSQPLAATASSIEPAIATNISQGSINSANFVPFTDPQTSTMMLNPMQNINQTANPFLNASEFQAI